MACSLEQSKAIYYYKCHDTQTAQVSNGALPWCSVDEPPYGSDLQDAVKRAAFRDLHPSSSLSSMDPETLRCELLGVPVNSLETEMRRRRDGLARGYARSCAPDYDVNRADIRNHFTCHYTGTYTDEQGRVGRHPFKSIKGSLFSCALPDGEGISDELMEDVKLAAYLRADGDTAKLDINEFACDIMSLPQ